MAVTYKQANYIGFLAIVFWSSTIGFARLASEGFGASLSPAISYTISSICLIFVSIYNAKKEHKNANIPYSVKGQLNKFLKNFPLAYVLVCGTLFALHNFGFVVSVGLSTSTRQVLEISLINYLWPSLIILFSVLFFKQKVGKLVYLGVFIAFSGIAVSTSQGSLSIDVFMANIQSNPVPYAIIFVGAILWGLYTNLLHSWQSHNCLIIFFAYTAVLLWICAYFLGELETISFANISFVSIFSIIALGLINALSYFAWEIGITKGNMTILAIGCYFIPILSTSFTSLCYLEMPDTSFFYGLLLVVCGSLISWYSTLLRGKNL